jgi:hypothetical protein
LDHRSSDFRCIRRCCYPLTVRVALVLRCSNLICGVLTKSSPCTNRSAGVRRQRHYIENGNNNSSDLFGTWHVLSYFLERMSDCFKLLSFCPPTLQRSLVMSFWISIVDLLSSGIAAAFWLRAALITVPDNIDTFVTELQRAGRWNAAGAAACVSFS